MRWWDVCLCKDTIMMLVRMRLSQLRLGHREDRAVPDGIPDGLRSMWSDTAALGEFVKNGALPPDAFAAFGHLKNKGII